MLWDKTMDDKLNCIQLRKSLYIASLYNPIKNWKNSPKFLSHKMIEKVYKALITSIIYSPVSPPSLEKKIKTACIVIREDDNNKTVIDFQHVKHVLHTLDYLTKYWNKYNQRFVIFLLHWIKKGGSWIKNEVASFVVFSH